MTAKLIVSVKEVNGIAQVVYYCKERRRIYRKSLLILFENFVMLTEKLIKNKLQLERATQLGYAQPLRSPVGEEVARPLVARVCTTICIITNIQKIVNIGLSYKRIIRYITHYIKLFYVLQDHRKQNHFSCD